MHLTKRLAFAVERQRRFGLWALAVLGVLFVVLNLGPRIEAKIAPVVTDYQITERSVDEIGAIQFTAIFYKRRGCELVRRTWYGIDENGVQTRAILAQTLFPDGEGRAERPLGWNRSQPTRLILPPDSVKMTALYVYHCALEPWESQVWVGPFDVWREPP